MEQGLDFAPAHAVPMGDDEAPPACLIEPLRDPEPMLARTLSGWDGLSDIWVFGYASLIWRPEFTAAEQRRARVHGQHRALKMRSRINRGTAQMPGLVFALVSGGSCAGMVYRIERERATVELRRLWAREMPTGVYDPKWLPCQTAEGTVRALAFTLARSSPSFTGDMDDDTLLRILRHARGRYGSTLDYLMETGACLRKHGIRDPAIERHLALARSHGLID